MAKEDVVSWTGGGVPSDELKAEIRAAIAEMKLARPTVVLFRGEISMEGELEECRKHLPTVEYRTLVPPYATVIPRYSALPNYQELEAELRLNGSRLANTYAQHKWIADLMDWGGPHGVLSGLTPMSWPNWSRLPEGAYIVKGRTNSRKERWGTHMFAPTLADVPAVAMRLLDDGLIRDQGVVVRQYVPLKKLMEGLNELPIVNEWRTFWWTRDDGVPEHLGHGFYWKASHPEAEPLALFPPEALELATEAARLVAPHVRFFVLDVAERADGGWIVVEVNDGGMSGLCGVPAATLYANLARVLE